MGGQTLEVVNQIRLVGLELTDDLTWTKNTQSLVRRAYAKIWMLRRLKRMKASRTAMLLIYFRHVRSILEFGVPTWNGAITQKEVAKLERVQRVALKLIFGFKLSYRRILEMSKLERLEQRRERMCLNFAGKALRHPRFRDWFKRKDGPGRAQFWEAITRKKRLEKSPIPYLTKLLNAHNNTW